MAQKLTLGLFLNSAIVTCMISLYITKNIFGPGGLIYTMFYFFIINSVTTPLLNLIDLDNVIRSIKIWHHKRKGPACKLTQ
jgi:hypothetical protein